MLKPGGVLVLNYIGSPGGRAFACLYLTLEQVFGNILALRAEETDDVQTITVFASDRAVEFNKGWQDLVLDFSGATGPDPVALAIGRLRVERPKTGEAFVLTDNYSPIDYFRAEEALRWRVRTAEIIGHPAM